MGAHRLLCALLLASLGSVCAAEESGLVSLGKRLDRKSVV
jgi:hypothetical protein